MRLGIGSYTFPWAIGIPGRLPERPMKALDLLDKASTLGVSVVQISDNLPLDRLPPPELDAVVERALDFDIEVGTRGLAPDSLHTYVRLAGRLGSRILRVVVDTADHHPPEQEVVRTIRALVPELERAGVVLAIENHDRFTAQVLASIVERIGSDYVGVCLDTVNSFGALEGPEVVVAVLAPYVVNLHVKDFVVERASHLMGFIIEGRPAGQGMLDVPRLLVQLDSQSRSPNAILELWTPPEVSLDATIGKEAAWAVESIRYLRQLIP